MTEPADESKTAVFKLHFENPPQFTIAYKDKEDLFRSFKKKLDDWNIPLKATYFVDLDGDHIEINDADALLGIVMLGGDAMNITVRNEVDNADSCPEFNEMIRKRRTKKGHEIDRGHGRELLGPCGRSHSRNLRDMGHVTSCCESYPSHDEPPFFHHPSHARPPMFCPLNRFYFPMDTGCGCYPFSGIGRGHGRHQSDVMRGHFHGY
ncbi:hypothetical protein KIN20_014041 [Parelaphostrongylus tenuis]|uniref:Uncharacterized protein n=1 Tax=Parelaphostrongylus tenuis TaxID=148309 RepID=A0AAD5MYE3_PARTN|nr:hypothetical protein KIN20_014041 [Parelaphostrongylus tenuis]